MRIEHSKPVPTHIWHLERDRRDRYVLAYALAAAVCVHLLLLLFVGFPEPELRFAPPVKPTPPTMWKYKPPPPPLRQKPSPTVATDVTERRTPVPFTRTQDHEPVDRWTVDLGPSVTGFEAPVLLGVPVAPPAPTGPKLPGRDGVTQPVLVLESKVQPDYPRLARKSRVEGRVVLQAVIGADGGVYEVRVLDCNRPGLGFEEAAIEAISRWRYDPATQDGVPVEVFFTIRVEFTLQ